MHSAIKKDDKIITAYRCHPFAVLRGGTIKGVIAELLGMSTQNRLFLAGLSAYFGLFLHRTC